MPTGIVLFCFSSDQLINLINKPIQNLLLNYPDAPSALHTNYGNFLSPSLPARPISTPVGSPPLQPRPLATLNQPEINFLHSNFCSCRFFLPETFPSQPILVAAAQSEQLIQSPASQLHSAVDTKRHIMQGHHGLHFHTESRAMRGEKVCVAQPDLHIVSVFNLFSCS